MKKGDPVVTYSGHKAEIVWSFSGIGLSQIVFEDLTSRLVKNKHIMLINTPSLEKALKSWDQMHREVSKDLFSYIEGFDFGYLKGQLEQLSK